MSAPAFIELDDEFFTGTLDEIRARLLTLPQNTVINRWEVQQPNGRIDNPGPETVQRYFARNDPDLVFDPDGIA